MPGCEIPRYLKCTRGRRSLTGNLRRIDGLTRVRVADRVDAASSKTVDAAIILRIEFDEIRDAEGWSGVLGLGAEASALDSGNSSSPRCTSMANA